MSKNKLLLDVQYVRGKKTKTEMLAFGVSYAKKCLELEDKLGIDLWLWDSSFRFENQEISLDGLAECEDAAEAEKYTYEADISLEELLLNKYYDGAILCEGYLYEALYYYQGYGDTSTYGRENTKILIDELRNLINLSYGKVTGKEYARIKAISEYRDLLRYETCITNGMDERKAAYAFMS